MINEKEQTNMALVPMVVETTQKGEKLRDGKLPNWINYTTRRKMFIASG